MGGFHNYKFMIFVLTGALLFSSVSAFWNFEDGDSEETAFSDFLEVFEEGKAFGTTESIQYAIFSLNGKPAADSTKWISERLYRINKVDLVAYMGDGVFFSYDLSKTYFFDGKIISLGLPPDGLVGDIDYAKKFEEYKTSFNDKKKINPLNDIVMEELYLWASTQAKNPKVAACMPAIANDYEGLGYIFYTCNSFVESALDYVFDKKFGCEKTDIRFRNCKGFFENTFTVLEPLGFSAMVFIYDPRLSEDRLMDPSRTDPTFAYTDEKNMYFAKDISIKESTMDDLVSKYSSSDNFNVVIFKDKDACNSFIAKFPRGSPMEDYTSNDYVNKIAGGYAAHQYMKSDGMKTVEAHVGGKKADVSCTAASAKECNKKGIFVDSPPDNCYCILPGDVSEGETKSDGFNCGSKSYGTIAIIYPNNFDPFKDESNLISNAVFTPEIDEPTPIIETTPVE
jgi:hypothetical protein